MRRRAVGGIAIVAGMAGMAALAPAASASVTARMTVTTPTPAAAGSTGNLGLDLNFTPSQSSGIYNDSPDAVTLNLPPGVLADAAIDNGACLQTADTSGTTCQLGSGVVTAYIQGFIFSQLPVSFYLVPPPAAGDLGGLEVVDQAGDQIGQTDAISIRPSGNPAGVGVTLNLVLPNTLGGQPITVTDINSTFSNVRFPATCPSTPANVTMSATSYAAPGTVVPASAPLPVSGCASLPYNPQYSLSVTKDPGSKIVSLKTTITQTAAESPNASVKLAFPSSSLAASIGGLKNLCQSVASGKCTPVGSVTATSPDYPTPLTGQAYLTGSLAGLTLTLQFPAPFPLTLVGSVDLKSNVTSFTGLPDIPLTNLTVSLNGGATGLFDTTCAVPTNTSTATLTDQNGDKTATPTSSFTIANCPPASNSGGNGGSSSSSGGSRAVAHITATRISGLASGKPSLRFTVRSAKKSKQDRLKTLSIKLPKGLSFRGHTVHKVERIRGGLKVTGAKLKSEKIRKDRLIITLRRPSARATISISAKGLKESASMRRHIRAKKIKRLRLSVTATNAKGKHTTIRVTVKHLGA